MSETIRVGGRECGFVPVPAERVTIRDADNIYIHLTRNGEWCEGFDWQDTWPTEAAAREFAEQHADEAAEPDQLTDAELAEGLAKGKLAKAPVAARQMFDYEEWFYRHGETALRELAALRSQLAAEREKRAALVRVLRSQHPAGELDEFGRGFNLGCRHAADQLAALDETTGKDGE